MASKRQKMNKKNRSEKRRENAGQNDSIGALIEKGRELLLQMLEFDAPQELVDGLSEAIDAAMQGDSFLLENFVKTAAGAATISDPSTRNEFSFSSAKAADLLRQAGSKESQRAMFELCQQALAADPESADAMVLMGDLSRDNNDCLEWYQKASQSIDRQLTKSDLEHSVSASRCHMGCQLMERTLFADAFEIMSPVLEYSPDTVRLEMIQIALMLEWHDELYQVLGKGEPLAGLDDYVEAIAAFQIHGNSEVSCRLLNIGFRQLPETARYLTGQSTIPQNVPNDPSSVAAIATAKCILPSMRTKPGLVKWVRDTLNLKPTHGDSKDSPLESMDKILQVDQVWEFHIVKHQGKTHLLCIDDQAPVHMQIFDHSPSNKERRDFLIGAMRFPALGGARKPKKIRFDTRKTLQACRSLIENLDVKSELLEKDVFTRAMLKSLIEKMADIAELAESPSPAKAINREELESVPMSVGLTWIVSIFHPPIWITDQATPRRCWNIHVVDANSGMIVCIAQSETAFSAQKVFDELANVMLNQNPPVRPESLLIEPRTDRNLFTNFSQIIRLEVGDDAVSDAMLEMVQPMVEKISRCRPAIDAGNGVTDKDVASYYQSAARFFKQSPWQLVQGDRVIGVRSLDFPDQHWGVSVIGQMGESLGLSITEGIDNAFAIIRQTVNITDLNLISILFGEDFDMIPSDLLMMEWRNRELASEDAYPTFLKMKTDSTEPLSPDQHELQMTAMLLNQLPSFLKSNASSSDEVILETSIGRRYSLSFEN